MLVNGVKASSDIEKVSFKGSQKTKNDNGVEAYDFFLPYDSQKYDAKVEIVPVVKKDDGWVPDEKVKAKEISIKSGEKTTFIPATKFLDDQNFAYRFKLTEKNNPSAAPIYHLDNGIKIADSKDAPFIIVYRNRAPEKLGRTMVHVTPDNCNPGWKMVNGKPEKIEGAREKIIDMRRNHFNLYDGNYAGLIERIPYWASMGVDGVLSTPLIGKDEISNHGYWTTNPFQAAEKLGTTEDFKAYQVGLFRHGMHPILDGAFVNEGLEGIHLRHNFKWGEDSYYKNWVKGSDFKTIGVLPNIDVKTKKGRDEYSHFKIRVVNGDFDYKYTAGHIDKVEAKRDKTQPTYVQVYDDRLVSEEQKKDNKLLRRYGKGETENHYEISTHNDSVLLVAEPVPQDELSGLYSRMDKYKDKYEKGDHADFLQSVLSFKNFQFGTKRPGNFNTWDGNVDVAKLNYTYTNKDDHDLTLLGASQAERAEYKQATCQVQDYVKQIGIFRTRQGRNWIIEDAAKSLSGVKNQNVVGFRSFFDAEKEKGAKLLAGEKGVEPLIPAKTGELVSDHTIANVLGGKYVIPQLEKTSVPKQRLIEDMMSYPLEAIEFNDDLSAVLGSPHISKKASAPDDIAKSRNEFFQTNDYEKVPKRFRDVYYDMDKLYEHKLVTLAHSILERADEKGKLGIFETKTGKERQLTEKGKLLLPLVTDDITRFLFVRALAPQVKVENKDGKLDYDYKALRRVGLANLNNGDGINASSADEEARQVFGCIKDGVDKLIDDQKQTQTQVMVDNIVDRFKDVSTGALKMANVVIDKTETGVHWRTDATKDVVEVDNIRNGIDAFDKEWDNSIGIWKVFFDGVRGENPNAHFIAEMTDLEDEKICRDGKGRFKNELDATSKFVTEAGASTITNYTYTFYSVTRALGLHEDGYNDGNSTLHSFKLGKEYKGMESAIAGMDGWGGKNPGMLSLLPAEGVKHLHNAAGNHDKPCLLTMLSLDMGIFQNNDSKRAQINDAESYLGTPNSDKKALAMSVNLRENIGRAANELGCGDKNSKWLKNALHDLTTGHLKGKEFDPEAYGTSSFRITVKDVIAQAKYNKELSLSEAQEKKLAEKSINYASEVGRQKSVILHKIMAVLPGDMTLYGGDEIVQTGYEGPFKNINIQNRGVLQWETLESKDPELQYVKDYQKEIAEATKLRTLPGCSALGNGETHFLSTDDGVVAAFRYNDEKDSELITLMHTKNVNKEPVQGAVTKMEPEISGVSFAPITSDKAVRKQDTVKGLVGGIEAVGYKKEDSSFFGTLFRNAAKKASEVYAVVDLNGEKVLKQFDSEQVLKDALQNNTVEAKAKSIKLLDNVTVLKKIHFGGGPKHNPNYIKIQAYLNGKTYLNQQPKYTKLEKAKA